jgi:hypothetical protein
MTCQAVQNQLLILPNPSYPGADVRSHLQVCAECRQWQRRLLRIEQSLPLVPVPPSSGRDGFVRQFLAGSGERTVPQEPAASSELQHGSILSALWKRRTWWSAVSAAAALVVVCLGTWAMWRPRELPVVQSSTKVAQPDPFVASLMQRDLRLAVAKTAPERLEVLAALSDDLFHETSLVIRGARTEDLQQLAQLYEKVVQEGIVQLSRAPSLRAADRRAVLNPIADQLARTARHADGLSKDAPGHAADALRLIADAACDADRRLRELLVWRPRAEFLALSAVYGATLVLLIEPDELPLVVDNPHQWQQLTRNRGLIQALVTSGVVLASEEDPLRRADQCNGLARHLVDEIQHAADREDDGRAAELGGHLDDLLKGGVVSNLSTVREHTPPDSTRHKELRRVSEDTQRVTDPLEKLYQSRAKTDPGELHRVLQSIRETRAEVDKVLKMPVKTRVDP